MARLFAAGAVVVFTACGGQADGGGASGSLNAGGTTGPSTFGSSGGTSSVNTGGNSSSGGCSNTPVTFQLMPIPNSVTHWCVGLNCYLGGITSVGTVSNASGALQLRSLCTLSCGTCTFEICPSPPGCMYFELTDQGEIQTWNGTYYTSNTCGASATACDLSNCASPGQYTYTVCAFPNPNPGSVGGCAQASSPINPTCVPVVFDYPASGPVIVTMPDP